MSRKFISTGMFVLALFMVLYAVSLRSAITNTPLEIVYKEGLLLEDETWTANNVYVIQDHVTVAQDVTLTVENGTVVKFNDNKLMGVFGALRVEGTSESPVTFTSLKDDSVGGDTNGDGTASTPTAGSWGHIAFVDDSLDPISLIDHAIFTYGGAFNNGDNEYYNCLNCEYPGVLRMELASPMVQNSRIENNDGWAFSVDIRSYPVLTANDILNNEFNAIELRGGYLSNLPQSEYHLSNTDLVYGLTGHITIRNSTTLVLDPGVVVKVLENKLIAVFGELRLMGTSNSPITITSFHDDRVGGDTNEDGTASVPSAGDWGHIAFMDSASDSLHLIDHAAITYGGYFDNGNNDYYDCPNCIYQGAIRVNAADPTITNSTIQNNDHGIWTEGLSNPTLTNNSIMDNSEYGLFNAATSDVDARNNYWGHCSGPLNVTTNPSGQGNAVSDHALFQPWVTGSTDACVSDSVQVYLPLTMK